MDFEVSSVPAPRTFPLRRAVLRPHQTIAEMALPDDDAPETGTYAAIDAGGEVLGTARVAPAPAPPDVAVLAGSLPDAPPARGWQLRAMATREDLRGCGVGSAVLGRVVRHVAENGGGVLWCNARLGALDFYRRAGLREHGDPWEEPRIGPHVVMWRVVGAEAAATAAPPGSPPGAEPTLPTGRPG